MLKRSAAVCQLSARRPIFILVLAAFFGLLGCKEANTEKEGIRVETYAPEMLDYPEVDIQVPDTIRLAFLKQFYAPWNVQPAALEVAMGVVPGKELSFLQSYLEDDEWYGENKKPHKKWQREAVVSNVDLSDFPNFLQKGITIAHTDVRRIPTDRPGFDTYSKAGEGFPFDYFQETGLWANTPILMVHLSEDKQWCYILSPYYKGWASMHDLALVDRAFMDQWMAPEYCLPLSDRINLAHPVSNYAIKAKLGMVLPYEEMAEKPDTVFVYYAASDENQKAHRLKAEVPRNALAFSDYALNGNSLRQLLPELLGRPYGWGGYLENRDCSSMIRDLFSIYRIWLPRDSKDQIDVGRKLDLAGSAEDKIRTIKEEGIPFLTILRKKGHNMLYVGDAPNGEPLILHAKWGLETSYADRELAERLDYYPIEGIHQDEDGMLHGRYIIGETVITSVLAGASDSGVTTALIEEIYAMTNILED